MANIGIFFGSDTGNMEDGVNALADVLGNDNVDIFDVSEDVVDKLKDYDKFIFASSTWGDGELQADWEDFIEELKNIDFKGKTIAIMGMGDQDAYSDTFCDAMKLIYDEVKDGNIVGFTSTDGYDYEESQSVIDNKFIGLVLDEDNQDDLSEERISNWANLIKSDFGI
jgi:flavodoxin I